jgi:hypothetical protein
VARLPRRSVFASADAPRACSGLAPGSSVCMAGPGTMRLRHRACGPNMPWYRIRLIRGRGVSAASFSRNSSGSKSR